MTIDKFIQESKEKIEYSLLKMLVFSFFNEDQNYLLNQDEIDFLNQKIAEVQAGKPIQYVIGNVDFYGNIIEVNENVLIPRFETEGLIEETVKLIKKKFNKKIEIVDLGTGSGCIAITLKKQIDCNVDAIDISKEALNVAQKNAQNNQVDINFIENNMLDNIDKQYDCIISNPPYISYDEKIEDIVKENEPSLALYAEDYGLYFYKKILNQAKNNLKSKYILAFEIGYQQGSYLKKYAIQIFPNDKILIKKDLSNKDRYLFIISE